MLPYCYKYLSVYQACFHCSLCIYWLSSLTHTHLQKYSHRNYWCLVRSKMCTTVVVVQTFSTSELCWRVQCVMVRHSARCCVALSNGRARTNSDPTIPNASPTKVGFILWTLWLNRNKALFDPPALDFMRVFRQCPCNGAHLIQPTEETMHCWQCKGVCVRLPHVHVRAEEYCDTSKSTP